MSNTIGIGDVYEREALGTLIKLEVVRFNKDRDIVFKIQGADIDVVITDEQLEMYENNGSMRLLSKG